MKQNFYILKNGKIIRKQNTVYFVGQKDEPARETPVDGEDPEFILEMDGEESSVDLPDISNKPEYAKRALPVEQIGAIFAYGRISITSGVVSFLAKYSIPIHFFGYHGHYESTLLPREALLSGEMHVRQAAHYSNPEKRMAIARAFVSGAAQNILKNLGYYQDRGLSGEIASIQKALGEIDSCRKVTELMAVEGGIRNTYYATFDRILSGDFSFGERTRRPPRNPVNAMVSFGNSLMYGVMINAIYHTQLDQTISFLHEPSERRFSLALDVAEIFKPFLVDRTIFKLVNKGMISPDDFETDLNSCLLNDNGRRLFLAEFNARMDTTIRHRTLKRNVSYGRLPYLECLKLCKHLMGMARYEPFTIWW
ncbi:MULTISPECIES: type I-B CRISPR-associated endonuclease Cas1b [unclassified Methanoculleus]|uniref:type I-B CRISPR-associated endonuclease Cas1b n=1 Tax=unclassified Methanoculleus TaxID=2619537 RepID=UPI0025F4C59A|nr:MULTISPECIES: type I-B CRISPR-associated endonuclease Cas1b [unclassified Methanoculleus]